MIHSFYFYAAMETILVLLFLVVRSRTFRQREEEAHGFSDYALARGEAARGTYDRAAQTMRSFLESKVERSASIPRAGAQELIDRLSKVHGKRGASDFHFIATAYKSSVFVLWRQGLGSPGSTQDRAGTGEGEPHE